MSDRKPRALDLANPTAPEYMWEPSEDGLTGCIFVFGYAGYFSEGDYVFFKGSDPGKRSMYQIVRKAIGSNENHQWRANLEYMSDLPDEYQLFPALGQSLLME